MNHEHIYAFIADGAGEGIVSVEFGGISFPMVVLGQNPKLILMMSEGAKHTATLSGKTIRLYKFENPKELQAFRPESPGAPGASRAPTPVPTAAPVVKREPLGGNETIVEIGEKVVNEFLNDGTSSAAFEAGIGLHDDAGKLVQRFKVRFEITVEPVDDFKGILPATRH